jgi:hypothetical protein
LCVRARFRRPAEAMLDDLAADAHEEGVAV